MKHITKDNWYQGSPQELQTNEDFPEWDKDWVWTCPTCNHDNIDMKYKIVKCHKCEAEFINDDWEMD